MKIALTCLISRMSFILLIVFGVVAGESLVDAQDWTPAPIKKYSSSPPQLTPEQVEIAKKVRNHLKEYKYQVKKSGNKYTITRNDKRNGIHYNSSYTFEGRGIVSDSGTLFTGDGHGNLVVAINGLGTATFKVDEYGHLVIPGVEKKKEREFKLNVKPSPFSKDDFKLNVTPPPQSHVREGRVVPSDASQIRVKVSSEGEEELKTQVISQVIQELNKLEDVEIVDENPDFILMMLMLVTPEGRIALSHTILLPLADIVPAEAKTAPCR